MAVAGGGGGGGTSIPTSAIARAAIRSDMEHRGFQQVGDSSEFWLQLGEGYSFDNKVLIVGDGYAHILGHPDDELPDGTEALQADVFDYWPQAVSETFEEWQSLPRESDFSYDASGLVRAANEIQLDEDLTMDRGVYQPGNARLGQDMGVVEQMVFELNGSYAEAFWRGHVQPLPSIVGRLHALATVLIWAVNGEAQIWKRVEHDLDTLGSDALAAMEASGPKGGAGADLQSGLTILGALASAVSLVNPGARAVAIAGKVSGVTGLLTTLLGLGGGEDSAETEPTELPLGAGTPQQVLTNIQEALAAIATDVATEELKIEQMLDATDGATTDEATDGNYDPDLQTGAGAAGWLDAAQDEIKVDADAIGRITSLYLTTIAADLRQCRRGLDVDNGGWDRPAFIGIGANGPWSAYSTLQEQVRFLLDDMAGELLTAGENLQLAAADIGLSDEAVNQRFDEEAARINRTNDNELQS